MKNPMKTFVKGKTLLFLSLAFIVAACSDDDGDKKSAERKLPEFMKFTGGAEGEDDGITIECLCDLNLELPEFEPNGETQVFTGSLGGEIIRAVADSDGSGFSFAPFLFGEIELTLKPNDSIYLAWPGNEGTGIPFYDEISLFKGKFNKDDGTVTGSWKCAPLDLDEGGYVDTHGTVEGTWALEEFE
jgi:hypothetical protein